MVVFLIAIVKHQCWGGSGPLGGGAVTVWRKKIIIIIITTGSRELPVRKGLLQETSISYNNNNNNNKYMNSQKETTFMLGVWYGMIWYMIWCDIWYDMICYMIRYYIYLTAVGLPPGGSSTVNIYTQTIHRTTQLTNLQECGPCPVVASYALAFALQLRKKHGKPSVRVAEECQLARWKQNIQNRAYIAIRIHNLQNWTKVYKTYNRIHNEKKQIITTLQHFATPHHTSLNYTSLHLSTLHFLSFTLHHPFSFGLTQLHFLPLYFTSRH